MNERATLLVPANKLFVEPRCFVGKDSDDDFDAVLAQFLKTLSRYKRVRIFDRRYDALYPGSDQRFGTRRRFTVMSMRLERNVRGAAAGTLTGLFQCDHFGVRDLVL